MTAQSRVRASVLIAAIVAAPAIAAADAETSTATIVPVYSVPVYSTPSGPVYDVPAGTYVIVPATVYVEPSITVYGDRRSEDQAITDDVANAIADDPRISGYVGVETLRNDVTLTGLVTTPGQAQRAARDARSVDGVRDVHNYVRARVGG